MRTEGLPDMPRTESDEALAVILRLKDRLNLTASMIADRFGWSRQYVTGMLNGTYPPRFELLRFLYMETFDADLARVIFGGECRHVPCFHHFDDGNCAMVIHALRGQFETTCQHLFGAAKHEPNGDFVKGDIDRMMAMLFAAKRLVADGDLHLEHPLVDTAA